MYLGVFICSPFFLSSMLRLGSGKLLSALGSLFCLAPNINYNIQRRHGFVSIMNWRDFVQSWTVAVFYSNLWRFNIGLEVILPLSVMVLLLDS